MQFLRCFSRTFLRLSPDVREKVSLWPLRPRRQRQPILNGGLRNEYIAILERVSCRPALRGAPASFRKCTVINGAFRKVPSANPPDQLAAYAQQPDRPKRIGMLMNLAAEDG